jgi:transketolase
MENFAAQEPSYRDRVLPPGVKARVSLEAASTGDWHRWVGDVGKAIGIKGFGGSRRAVALYEHFGLTPERVALAGRRSLRRRREKAQVG